MPRVLALVTALGLAAGLAGCGTSDGDDTDPAGSDTSTTEEDAAATNDDGETPDEPSTGGETVTLTWWHNGTADPLLSYWQGVADAYMAANPNVIIEVTPVQNEDLQTKIIAALQGGDAPDIFAQWGGQEGTDQWDAGYLMDLTQTAAGPIAEMGGAVNGWTSPDGHVYGLPFTMGIGGIYYNKDLFAAAGITAAPTTMDELGEAVAKLQDSGVAPIALGGVDEWPAAHWWYWLALRECTKDVVDAAATDKDFSDPCFLKAGQDLQAFADLDPFQEGFMSASAQQGAQSSAGMLANGQAAMELMGVWEPGILRGLTETGELDFELGWFPFPGVTNGLGDPTAAMGGGDGFSCWSSAPAECTDVLNFLVSQENQEAFATTGSGIPVVPGAEAGLEDPVLQDVFAASNTAAYVELWMDKLFGNNVGGALNTAVTEMLGGANTPEGVIQAMQDAAAVE
jgi:raffinose/stachyose/melibiose transport system substrate-binding protein